MKKHCFCHERFVIFDRDTNTSLDFIRFRTCAVNYYSPNATMEVKASIGTEMFIEIILRPALSKTKCSFLLHTRMFVQKCSIILCWNTDYTKSKRYLI